MSRYICVDEFEPDTEWSEYEDGFMSYSQLQIDSAPSIDIVRCGECKHRQNLYAPKWCYEMSKETNADDFCSYGEREGE